MNYNLSKILYFTRYYFLFLLTILCVQKSNAQSNYKMLELQTLKIPFECHLRICVNNVNNCPIDQTLKFDNESKIEVPFNVGSVSNVTINIRDIEQSNLASKTYTWTGYLQRQWFQLTPTLRLRAHLEPVDCPPGFAGPRCSIRASTCNALKPCQNGGSCFNLKQGAYECKCLYGYTGSHCERRMETCEHDNPCQNGAECQQNFGQPLRCLCPSDYHGQFCQVYARNCSSLPCQNEAPCVPINGDFGCVCKPGYVGKICDQKISKCTRNTCGNYGTCIENLQKPNGIECLCRPGFFGPYCSIIVSDCRTSPCLNNGHCQANISSFHCQCPLGYTGNFCEVRIKTIELELRSSSSSTPWIIPLIVSLVCFTFITIFGIWLIHTRYRRWTIRYFDNILASLWFLPNSQRPQQSPPKIKPPPLPLLEAATDVLLKAKAGTDELKYEKKPNHKPRVLSADALCQNLYVEDPTCTSYYSSIYDIQKETPVDKNPKQDMNPNSEAVYCSIRDNLVYAPTLEFQQTALMNNQRVRTTEFDQTSSFDSNSQSTKID